jgi:hypothetical protein
MTTFEPIGACISIVLTLTSHSLNVIPGRRKAASPVSITPAECGECAESRLQRTCGYGFRAPLAEPVLGRRVAPIRVLAARNDGVEQFVT